MAKKKYEKIDGLSERDKELLIRGIMKVWQWSTPHKLCIARATDAKGFGKCELCKKRVPKLYVDHIVPRGTWDNGYIDRTFIPSIGLQATCKKCHQPKTNEENRIRRQAAALKAATADFLTPPKPANKKRKK